MRQDPSNVSQRSFDGERAEPMNRKEFLREAGRSLLGLLSLPTVASITGCGPKEVPTPVQLADLLARPWQYDEKLIVVEGYVQPGEGAVSSSTSIVASGKAAFVLVSHHKERAYRMFLNPDNKGKCIPVIHAEYTTGFEGDHTPSSHRGLVVVTGRLRNDPDNHGWALSTRDIKSLAK
jgi:hypothetical protein